MAGHIRGHRFECGVNEKTTTVKRKLCIVFSVAKVVDTETHSYTVCGIALK